MTFAGSVIRIIVVWGINSYYNRGCKKSRAVRVGQITGNDTISLTVLDNYSQYSDDDFYLEVYSVNSDFGLRTACNQPQKHCILLNPTFTYDSGTGILTTNGCEGSDGVYAYDTVTVTVNVYLYK